MLSEGDPELVRVDRIGNHMLSPIAFRMQRPCAYCKKRNGRFRGGQVRRSYYECSICQVPLCRPQSKPCFLKYHEDLVSKMHRKWLRVHTVRSALISPYVCPDLLSGNYQLLYIKLMWYYRSLTRYLESIECTKLRFSIVLRLVNIKYRKYLF